MKNLLAAALLVAFSLTMTVGCGGDTPSKGSPMASPSMPKDKAPMAPAPAPGNAPAAK